jgi:hypothetical protein
MSQYGLLFVAVFCTFKTLRMSCGNKFAHTFIACGHHHHYHHHAVRFFHSERVLQRVRSGASYFDFQYLLVSLKSSSSCLRLLLCISVPSVFTSITCFRKQILRKTIPIYLAFVCGYAVQKIYW